MVLLGVSLFVTDVLTDFDMEDWGVLTPEILNLNMLSDIHDPSKLIICIKSSLPFGVETRLGVLLPHEESDL